MNFKILAVAGIATALASSSSAQTLTREVVASGFSVPIAAKSPPGDYERIFVAQRDGRVRIIKNGSLLGTDFKDIPGIQSGGEQGLLGIAFHPDYQNNGYFYASFTNTSGDSQIDRWTADPLNPDRTQNGSRTTVFGPISQPAGNHNGGDIEFGPDGYLYYALGDGGGANDTACNAQKGNTYLGKMLRLDVDSGLPATAPASNPFVGNPSVLDEIWAIGLRNPWQFSFDRETGDMWIGDVGQSCPSGDEEINFQPAASVGGENYGWKIRQGFNSYQTGNCPGGGLASFAPVRTDPVRVHDTCSNNSIIGGYRYRGCAMPGRHGLYVYGNYGGGKIYTFEWNGSSAFNFVDRTSALGNGSSLYAFGEDYDGEILICHGSQVSRIVPDGILNNQDAGAGSVGSNGLTPIYEVCGTLGAGNTATFRTRNAPPSAAGSVLFGTASNPIPLPIPGFGTLVPGIVAFTIPYPSDADGIATWQIDGGTWPFTFFHQAAFLDAGISGVTLSNAFETNFSSLAPPTVSSVSPLSATVGQTITVNGSDFAPTATVDVGGSGVTPISISATTITFAMPAGVSCDTSVTVTNPDFQNDSATFNPTPTISGTFLAGPQFVITGTGFSTGTVVTVNGTPLTINTLTPTFISAVIPSGASTGDPIVMTTPGGCVTNSTYP